MPIAEDNDGIPYMVKDPDEVLDYIVDFAPLTNSRYGAASDWLLPGETLSSHAVSATTGITIDADSLTATDTAVLVWLSGGTLYQQYDIDCIATTSANRTVSRSFRVKVRHR